MSVNREGSTYDLVVIGGGSAASAAAAEALRLGKSVAKVQDGPIAGTCLNVGCIPSKTLLIAAADHARARRARFQGVNTFAGTVDLRALVADKEDFLDTLRRNQVEAAKTAGFADYRGRASFVADHTTELVRIRIDTPDGVEELQGSEVIIATGADSFIPPIPGLDSIDYLTSASAMALETLPASLLVIGGNAIGLEQAQLFSDLGTRVTVIEIAARIAPLEDPEMSTALQGALASQGMQFVTNAHVSEVSRTQEGVVMRLRVDGQQRELTADAVLVATGRRPLTDSLNLGAIGIETGSRGEVPVDENLRTVHPHVWAAGDVTGQAQFVYVATAQGRAAAANALGNSALALDYANLPRVTFTSPPIASVGLTAAQAMEQGIEVDVRRLDMAWVSRALVNRETDGLLKLVTDRASGRIIGAQMVGHEAGEIIAAAGFLASAGVTVQQLGDAWAPYLTMMESLQLIARTPAE
ncbi:mercury(II) reductase [Microbacterium sp. SY138]|uniref:mercury(II) reductase n=1 Tax=unclassified Microbacterium TaxID=2609290 RepID=UPI00321B0D41